MDLVFSSCRLRCQMYIHPPSHIFGTSVGTEPRFLPWALAEASSGLSAGGLPGPTRQTELVCRVPEGVRVRFQNNLLLHQMQPWV